MKTIVCDSSVWFAACCSPTGGSSKIFSLNKKSHSILVTKTILAEVEKNVVSKLLHYNIERFFKLTEDIEIADVIVSKLEITQAMQCIHRKDAIILAEMVKLQPYAFITLDKKHFLNNAVFTYCKKTKVLTPKEYLTK